MIVLVIIAIVSVVGGTYLHGRTPLAKLNGVGNDLRTAMLDSRMTAVRRNQPVVIEWQASGNSPGYTLYIDFNGNWSLDGTDQVLGGLALPGGISATGPASDEKYRFTPQGYFEKHNGSLISTGEPFTVGIDEFIGGEQVIACRSVVIGRNGLVRYLPSGVDPCP